MRRAHNVSRDIVSIATLPQARVPQGVSKNDRAPPLSRASGAGVILTIARRRPFGSSRGDIFRAFVTRSHRSNRPRVDPREFREQAAAFSALPPLSELADH
jgi:hypothetical protein